MLVAADPVHAGLGPVAEQQPVAHEVLFDGLEISQFTYFQQAGGVELSPISAELTYGLERIAMALQRVDSLFDLETDSSVVLSLLPPPADFEPGVERILDRIGGRTA